MSQQDQREDEEIYEALYASLDASNVRASQAKDVFESTLMIVKGQEKSTAKHLCSLGEAITDINEALYTLNDTLKIHGVSAENIKNARSHLSTGHLLAMESELSSVSISPEKERVLEPIMNYALSRFAILKTTLRMAENNLAVYSEEQIKALSEVYAPLSEEGVINIAISNAEALKDLRHVENTFTEVLVAQSFTQEERIEEPSLFEAQSNPSR